MSAPHADRDHSEQPVAGPLCARCGQPALGFATINGVRYCHADERTCYRDQRWDDAGFDPADRAGSARVVRASEAQVEAAAEALQAVRRPWRERLARAVADAVVAAGADADEVASLRQRLSDMADEYGKAGESWDRSRERLEAEVKRLSDEASRSATEVKRLTKAHLDPVEAQARVVASVTPCSCSAQRSRAEAAEMARDEFERAYVAVVAERDRLAATVERVEALADHYARCAKAADRKRRRSAQRYKAAELWLRAALDDPATTPETPHAPAGAPESVSGQSGTGEAPGGAQGGWWRARCDVPGCGWFSLPYKAREGADKAGYNHWLSKGHGSTIRGRR